MCAPLPARSSERWIEYSILSSVSYGPVPAAGYQFMLLLLSIIHARSGSPWLENEDGMSSFRGTCFSNSCTFLPFGVLSILVLAQSIPVMPEACPFER